MLPRHPSQNAPGSTISSQDRGRGVFRELICPAGEQWYKIVTSAGKVGIIHLPDDLCDAQTEERLWARLDEKDPERHLRAI